MRLPPRASRSVAAAVLVCALGGCPDLPGHRCLSSDQCGVGGRCEPAGACSFPDAACSSGRAYGDETPAGLAGTCVSVEASGCTVASTGAIIDDAEPCFVSDGLVGQTGGYLDHHAYTLANSSNTPADSGRWNLDLTAAGSYRVELYAVGGETQQAAYHVHHGQVTDIVMVDQTTVFEWSTLGTFAFDAGPDQWVYLPDNTGESVIHNRAIVYDAIRLTRL